jgi:RNA polymerase sigma factor (sigma-70 family)
MAMVDMPAQRVNREFIRGSMSAALLTREREQDLARRWRGEGDEAALHELVLAYMRLVISTATRFRNYGLPMSDLVQEGAVGLMQAAARFEPERGVRFSTYAAWWIRSAMQDFILRNWSVVRTGTTAAQKALFFNLRRLRAKLEDGGGALDDRIAEVAQLPADIDLGTCGRVQPGTRIGDLRLGLTHHGVDALLEQPVADLSDHDPTDPDDHRRGEQHRAGDHPGVDGTTPEGECPSDSVGQHEPGQSGHGSAHACLVSDTPHGQHDLRMLGILLDLRPQPLDMDVDQPGVGSVLVTPHLTQQNLP